MSSYGIISFPFVSVTDPPQVKDYCDAETFNASCPDNHVIYMRNATYGRMRLGDCVELNLGYIGCGANVLPVTDRICSGRQQCEIRVPDKALQEESTCMKELRAYLEASYSCVPGEYSLIYRSGAHPTNHLKIRIILTLSYLH